MTNQNHQTNGASLEDCHTNFFALTELYGIKWRKLVWGESSGGGGGGGGGEEEGGAPLADPVISSYARCLAGDILCVWRRVPQAPVDIYDMPAPPPPLSLRAAKELWIFWYGEEPDLSGLVAPELIASQGDQGSWESGLSYECRSLLFKALHNLIERCLLSRDFVRLGKWFVQPYDGDEEDVGKSPWHLSFSFAFFLHGESTVCASVDVRQHPPVRTLTARRLRRVHQPRHNSTGQGTAQGAPEPVRDKVILAPFGLEGTVTGREWADGDAATARLLDAWRHLYPLEQGCGAVEVVCGGVTMRYPLPYVLATEMEAGAGAAAPPLAAACLAALTTPCPTQPVEVCYADASDKEDIVDPTRKAVCTCAKAGAALACGGSPGSCGAASPAPPSAPPSAGPHAHASPASAHPAHQTSLTAMVSAALGGAVAGVPASLHTPAPTPDPLAPHTPHTPVPAPAANAAKGYQTDSPSAQPSGGGAGASRPELPPAERRLDPLEDEHSLKMLYDYTTVYAWLEHPVKRFKSEDSSFREDMALGPSGAEDLYAGHEHTKMAAIDYRRRDIKQEKQEDEKEYKNKNLFTSDGLCPTLKDLDQIFDNSDDAASGDETVRLLQVQTPPDSNRSLEESRLTNAGAARSVRPEELSKMFPTPPSLEAHAQPSPGFSLPDDTPHHQTHPGAHAHAHRLGPASPPPDPIEDWSYVFKPPTVCKYVGSSKYAPLTTLPSQLLPPVALPPRAAYRPRWQREAQQPPQPAPQTSVGTPQQPDPHGQRTGSVKRSSSPTPSETRARGRRSAAPTPAPRAAGSPDAAAEARPLPPACPLLVNVLLTDTVLNVFRDHNFDSCTLCVCNAGPKVVGNIRGADAVTYLPMALDGAADDDPAHCTCGFSAILNRRLAHKAGLFYEDEMEITGLTEEPGGGGGGPGLADVAAAVLRQVGVPAAPRHSALARLAAAAAHEHPDAAALNLQEYADGGAAAARALRAAVAAPSPAPAGPGPAAGAVHRWPFIGARAPRSSRDVVRLMRRLRPLLQDAIQKRCSGARMWDGVTGPLTWRQFHRLAGRGNEDLCEPQPVPPLLVGHDRDWLSLSPYALRHWERLALEPYSHPRDVAYVVVAADAEPLAEPLRAFFRELSAAYEACRLGRHRPVGRVGRDGLVRAPAAAPAPAPAADEWAGPLPAGRAGRYVRAYAETLRAAVVPALAERALLEPERPERPPPEPMRPPGTPDHPPTPSSQSDQEEVSSSCSGVAPPLSSGGGGGTPWDGEESGPPALVVYLVEPPGSAAERARTLHALLRIADAAQAHLHHHNPLVKIISLEGICETWGFGCSPSVGPVGAGTAGAAGGARAARALALSVFTGARRKLRHRADGKSLTGFGTAADGNLFLNNKDEKNRGAYSLFAPLWVLAPARALKDVAESWGAAGDSCGVLFLAYCLSHDQRHLLAAATDARGELLDTIAINIHVPARSRRRRGAAARRLGLTKLMDFILGVMSQAAQPWRLVVGRVGRIGHGELKGWSWLLSRKNLMRASNVLREICSSCSVLYPSGVPCILSACLVSTEPDSCLRLMADRFTPDERFSQVSIQSHLHTPRDVSATHILVFPTSATTQSNQMPFEPPLANGEDNDMNMFLDVDMGDEDIGEDNMTDLMGDMLFTNMWAPGSPGRQSPRRSREGSPAVTRPSQPGGEDSDHQQEQVGTVLQQPLALGYLVSTAPLGGMPAWWWAGCAHLRDACPAFLKNALLLHAGSVQNADDYTSFTQRRDHNTHPLDSQTTTDVLRYVLEGYNALSWLALDGDTHDRMSCLPFHVQVLMQLYHTAAALG